MSLQNINADDCRSPIFQKSSHYRISSNRLIIKEFKLIDVPHSRINSHRVQIIHSKDSDSQYNNNNNNSNNQGPAVQTGGIQRHETALQKLRKLQSKMLKSNSSKSQYKPDRKPIKQGYSVSSFTLRLTNTEGVSYQDIQNTFQVKNQSPQHPVDQNAILHQYFSNLKVERRFSGTGTRTTKGIWASSAQEMCDMIDNPSNIVVESSNKTLRKSLTRIRDTKLLDSLRQFETRHKILQASFEKYNTHKHKPSFEINSAVKTENTKTRYPNFNLSNPPPAAATLSPKKKGSVLSQKPMTRGSNRNNKSDATGQKKTDYQEHIQLKPWENET